MHHQDISMLPDGQPDGFVFEQAQAALVQLARFHAAKWGTQPKVGNLRMCADLLLVEWIVMPVRFCSFSCGYLLSLVLCSIIYCVLNLCICYGSSQCFRQFTSFLHCCILLRFFTLLPAIYFFSTLLSLFILFYVCNVNFFLHSNFICCLIHNASSFPASPRA